MSLPQRLQAIDSSVLHVRLALTNGYFAADAEKTVFEPTASFVNSFNGSTETAKRALVVSLNQAFRSSDKVAFLNFPVEERDAIRKGEQRDLSKFNPVINFTGTWEEAQEQFANWAKTNAVSEEEAPNYLPTLLQTVVEEQGGLDAVLANTPCLWREMDTTDPDVLDALYAGSLSFIVADPISDSDLNGDMFEFGSNKGGFDKAGVHQRELGRLLKPLKGELWDQSRIQRQVGDFLADIGFDSYHSALSPPPSLQWTSGASTDSKNKPSPFHYVQLVRRPDERRVVINGSPRLAAIQMAVRHTNALVLNELLYLILPHHDYQRVSQNPSAFLTNTVGAVEEGSKIEFVNLDFRTANGRSLPHSAPYVNHRVLRDRLAQIQTLGYQATLSEESDAPVAGFSTNDTKWARLVVFPTAGFGAASQISNTNNAVIGTNRLMVTREYRNHLKIGGGVESKQPVTLLMEYSRDGLLTNDSLSVKVGWRGEPIFGGNYQRDFLGFDGLGRRLSLNISGDTDFRPDRLVNGQRADERRSGGGLGAQLELFRDKQDNWLRLETSIGHQEVELKNTAPNPGSDGISRATIGLSYSWLHQPVIGSPGLEIDPSISVGRASRNHAVFVQPSLKAAYHRNWPGFFETDSRASFDWASSGTPATELPGFGGEDSVRGFRLEAASGRLVWALQNEVWIPLRFTDYFGEKADALLRRSLKLAAFVDLGGVDKTQQRISSFEAGAGLGLRFSIRDQATLRLDWAHPLTGFTRDQGGHAIYFSILLKPAHF